MEREGEGVVDIGCDTAWFPCAASLSNETSTYSELSIWYVFNLRNLKLKFSDRIPILSESLLCTKWKIFRGDGTDTQAIKI